MFETHTTPTYDGAFARARAERSAAFHRLFGFRRPGWRLLAGARTA
ncbi:hypothetical protein [Jannaschia formosa]|nr:hypothetical protein [Jannaschia formosa]